MRQIIGAICATSALWSSGEARSEGLVLVLDNYSGSFVEQQQAVSFARHFGPGGEPILPFKDSSPDEEPSNDASIQAVRRVLPSDEVLVAIEEVGLRYAGHVGLRQADMSVTEWLAFFQANIEIESAYRQDAVSPVGAIGLGQLMPGTASVLGVDPNDSMQNLDGSARYLLMLLERFGSKELALAGYNAGPEAVAKYDGIPPYDETQGHVRKVMAVYGKLTETTETE